MKSMQPNSAAIFFMTYFYRAAVGRGHGPLGPPRSATGFHSMLSLNFELFILPLMLQLMLLLNRLM